jgi:hypothetical protein
MQRLDHHQIWRDVRGSLAEAPVPVRLALSSESTLERRTALDRLAAFIATRVSTGDEEDDDDQTLPLFPELEAGAEPQPEKIVMDNVIEKAPSFGRWLIEQRGRDDAIGALAKQAHADPAFPRDGSPKDVSQRLNAIGADGDAHQVLEDAELDWLAL